MPTSYFTQTTIRQAQARATTAKRERRLMPKERLEHLLSTQPAGMVYPIVEATTLDKETVRCLVLLSDRGLQGYIDMTWAEYQELPALDLAVEYVTPGQSPTRSSAPSPRVHR